MQKSSFKIGNILLQKITSDVSKLLQIRLHKWMKLQDFAAKLNDFSFCSIENKIKPKIEPNLTTFCAAK